ncbi:MAG: hypothetical protein WBH00_23205 [Xanthobacteraceae bacterium]
MIRSLVLAACFCALACLSSVAEARPKSSLQKMQIAQGCSDPVMRPCEEISRNLKASRFQKIPSRVKYVADSRPRAWCGWYLSRYLGKNDRRLWRALAWRHVGRAAHGPAIGVVVIWSRGKGRGHVGIITGKTARGWVVKSGNDGNAVRERVRSVAGAIAFRWP